MDVVLRKTNAKYTVWTRLCQAWIPLSFCLEHSQQSLHPQPLTRVSLYPYKINPQAMPILLKTVGGIFLGAYSYF